MKTRLVAILICLTIFNLAYSQKGFKNNGAKVIVNSGGIINITGGTSADFINASSGSNHGRIDLDGKIKLEGDWSNNATSGGVFINVDADGDVQFLGTSAHSVAGSQTDFEKLTLNTSGNVTLSASATANGNLTLTNGLLVLGTNNLTLGAASAISGTPSASNMVVASSTGELRKTYTGAGSFTYPIGDNTSTVEYSPITLNFASGTFGASAYAGARVTNAKHPNNTSTTGYINRYWSLSQNNISGYSCGLTATYTNADIFGTETSLFSGYYSTPYWVKLAAVNAPANQLTGTVSALNPITAGDQPMFCTSTITINEVVTNVACYGNSTGAINVTVTGGYGTYSYNWSGTGVVATQEDQTGLTAGTYYLTVTDQNGCVQTDVFTITQPSASLALSSTQTNVNCYGNSTGAIDLTVTGGTPSYTYSWSNAATSQDLSSIAAGNYFVTVTDGNGCQANTSATITQPASALSVALTSQTNVSCFGGNNGAIDITVSGGTIGTGYTYNWGGGITTEDRSNLIAGTYTVTVTDANSCIATKTATITQPAAALAVSITSQTNVNCFGNSTGAINITATGGTTPYNYNWGGGITTEDRTGLSAGNYSVTVTDTKGCTANVATTITQPSAALAVVVTSQTNINCNGNSTGAINITASGGTPTYTYNWGTVTTEDRTNIAAGTYTVTVTDFKSCTASVSATITEPSALAIVTSKVDATCFGSNDGSATVVPSGGTTPYSYAWDDAAFQTTATASNLVANTYNVTVIDNNGCSKLGSAIVSQPTLIVLTPSSTQASCGISDGSASVSATGGAGSYAYDWAPNGYVGDGSTTYSSVPAGTYTVTVTDIDGCFVTENINVSESGAPTASISTSTNVSCFGGSNGQATVTVSGGTPGYTYLWTGGQTTAIATNLTAGIYNVTVKDNDGAGCSATASVTITQPTVLNASITSSTNVSCFGGNNGSATVTVSGGTPSYTYNWTGGLTTSTINNLTAGTYDLTVTDNKGCTKTTSVTITQPTLLTAGINSLGYVSCHGGNDGYVGIVVSGGTLPYSYIWSNGSTNEDLSSLVAGSYYFTATDANGCTVSNSLGTIVILEPASALTLSASSLDVNCFNGSDGSINLTVSGGTTSYSYLWSNNATTEDLAGIIAGSYTVTVTDANNCVASLPVLINQPSESLLASIAKTDVKCFGNSTGAIDLTVTGGTTSYSYLWSDNSTSEDLANIAAGNYAVTVTDANGCQVYTNATISQPSAALLSTNVQTNVSCFGGANGSIDVTISGGTTPYSYSWSNSTSNQDLYSLSAGNYGLTVTDFNNCQITSSYTITEPTQLVLSMSGTDVSCYGGTNGSVSTSVSGGVTSYSYLWNNNATTQNQINIYAGIHTVTVTDSNGCTISDNYTVNQPDELVTSSIVNNISCYNAGDGSISLTVVGGTTPYSFSWDNTSTNQNITSLGVGSYSYTVSDVNGCSNFGTESITQPDEIILDVLSFNASCGNSNGEAIVSVVSGGIAPFTYHWSNNDNTASISSLSNGTYNVTVTDNSGCTATASAVIGITYPPTVSISNSTDATCFGTCNGNATVQISGGQTPYSIMWNDPSNQTTTTANGLCEGSYGVTVTDANSCSSSASVTINQPTAIVVTSSSNPVTCFGTCDGSASLSVSGGISSYTYLWSDGAGQTSSSASNLCSGNYNYTVTDSQGCVKNGSVLVGTPDALTASIVGTDVTCNAGNDGAADLTVSGGITPYTYVWSNTLTTEDLSSLIADSYTVTVKDANLCSTFATVNINEPVLLIPTITGNLSYCSGSNTVLDAGSYSSYLWSNNETTQTITVTAGTYTVTVVNTNGCTGVSASVDVIENTLPSPSITGTLSYCSGLNTTLDAGSYSSYLWSNNETTQIITATAGTYTVTVVDANGCTGISASVDVIENSLPTPTINGDLSYCAGSNTTLDAGVYPNYLWSTNETTQSVVVTSGNYEVTVTDANGCSAIASAVVVENALPIPSVAGSLTYCVGFNTTLDAGIYNQYLWSTSASTQTIDATIADNPISVTVTDANGCIGVSSEVNVIESTSLSPVITGNFSYCSGLNTTLTAGVYPSYLWSTNETTQSIIATSGTYTVTVSDANGCTGTASVDVIENPLPVPVISGLLSYCAGSNTTLDAGVFSSYNWSNGESSEVLYATAGTYVVTVTDDNGCQGVSASVDVVENSLPLPTISGDLSYCSGSSTTLDAGLFDSYLWSNGETTQTISATAGPYDITVTDANGCMGYTNVFVTENTLPVPTINGELSYCAGSTTTLDAGVFASYEWSSGEFTQTVIATAGSYTVSVTDVNGCVGSSTVDVAENPIPTPSINGDLSYCAGSNTSLDAGLYNSYLWSSGETSQTISATAGTYYVTVTDNIGCQGVSAAAIITENDLPIASIIGTNVTCNNSSTGSADLTVINGTTPYTFLWNNGSITEDINGLIADIYYVTVTDNNGCNDVASVSITEPDVLVLSSTVTPENAGNDGAIDVTISGGTIPYSFAWSNLETTEDLTGLASGIYSITVTDANGCTISQTFTVNNINCTLTTALVSSNISCYGLTDGFIDLIVVDGASPININWSNLETTEDIFNLSAGDYIATITDAAGCTSVESATITSPSELIVSVVGSDITCNGLNDGTASLTISGGISPYNIEWSNNEINEVINNLSQGTYGVTVNDINSCQVMSSVTINEPSVLSSTSIISDVTCFGQDNGSIDLTVSGGTTPYNYTWSNFETTEDISNLSAGSYSVTVSDNNGCSIISIYDVTSPSDVLISGAISNISCFGNNNGAIDLTVTGGSTPYVFNWSNLEFTEDLTGLSASTYDVTVTDFNSCQALASFTISEPTVLSTSVVYSDITCNGNNDGSIDVTVTGGTTPYSFSWDNSATTEDLFGLSAGDYTGVVTDANGCTDGGTITISEPSALMISSVVVPENSGNDGSIDLTVTGGITPYTFNWDNLAITEDLTGLASGLYTVTVADANGCSETQQFVVNNVSCTLVASLTSVDATCYGLADGSVDLTVSGGTTPYSYNWSNTETTEDISGLVAGNYQVTISDNSGCLAIENISVSSPLELLVSAVSSDITCNGANDGTIDLTVTGGTTPYSFDWSNLEITEDLSGLSASVNDVTITDSNMCQVFASISINEPDALSSSFVNTDVTCNGGMNGAIDLTVIGGTIPYSYSWDNATVSEDLTGLTAGNYSVIIADANGCSDVVYVTISEPAAIFISSIITPETVNDGAIDITVTGGTTPYTFAWSNLESTEDISGLSAGIYTVVVTDANGCSESDQFIINNVACTLSGGISGADVSCFGLSDGAADLTVTGGTTPYSFAWSNLESTEDITGIMAGDYDVTITDAASCVEIVLITINQPAAITLSLSSTDDFGTGDGTATVIVTGGTSPYTYLWDDGLAQSTSTAINLVNNLYNVTVTDFNGCTATDTITVKLYVGVEIVDSYLTALVYPNPAKDVINVLINTSSSVDVEFVIYDAIGQVVYSNKVAAENGSNLFNVDLSNKADGIYFIKFNNAINNQLIRFVKSGN